MKIETYDRFGDGRVILTCYISDTLTETTNTEPKAGIMICPGGGYRFVSGREKEPVALAFAAKGYHAFTLVYRTNEEALGLRPLTDLAWAMNKVRNHAAEWNLNSEKIAVCGFSAGGHLAASLGTRWIEPAVTEGMGIAAESIAPNALILSYPVIVADDFAHKGSIEFLLGKNVTTADTDKVSLEKQVGKHTPPTFMWHTYTDSVVPLENSLAFASALRKNGIPFEYHVFAEGGHGYSLANEFTANGALAPNTHIAHWMELAIEWLKIVF